MLPKFLRLACLSLVLGAAALAAGEAYRHPEPAELKPGVILYRSLDQDKYELLGTITVVTTEEVSWKDSEGKGEKTASIRDVAKYWFIVAEKS